LSSAIVEGELLNLEGWTNCDFASCGISLAAGLILAAQNSYPDTSIWATGVIGPNGTVNPVDVGGLIQKAELAKDWGAKKLFVSSEQDTDALACDGLEICKIEVRSSQKWRDVLGGYLFCLDGGKWCEKARSLGTWYKRDGLLRVGGSARILTQICPNPATPLDAVRSETRRS
jgi:hypothetical protein